MNEPVLPPQAITTEKFIDYLIEKNVSSQCLCCGKSGAYVSTEDDEIHAVQSKADSLDIKNKDSGGDKVSKGYVLSLMTICLHCGFIRQFASQSVYRWLATKQNEGEVGK